MYNRMKLGGLAASACLAFGGLAAGCGSSSSNSGSAASGSTASGSAASGAASTSAASGSGTPVASKKLTGPPVKIADITEVTGPIGFPGDPWGTGAKAAAAYINNQLGGFGGRPVEIIECDSKGDPGATLACANSTAAQKVVSTVGLSVNFGANGLNVYKKHGIPSMNAPVSAQDFSDPDSFPIGGGILSEFTAQPRLALKYLHAKNMVWFGQQNASTQTSVALAKEAFKAAGGGTFTVVTYPPNTADLTSAVAEAVSAHPDIVLANTSNADGPRIYAAFQQQGWPATKIFNQGGAVDYDTFFTYEFDSFDDMSNPEVATYRHAMETYAHVPGRGEFFQWPFANVMTIYNAAKAIGFAKFNAATLKAYLSKAEGVPIFMGYKLSNSATSAAAPAIRNPYVKFVQWKDGKLVPVVNGWIKGG
jgi:branched-chain amino acid transport system substrate-binding protein